MVMSGCLVMTAPKEAMEGTLQTTNFQRRYGGVVKLATTVASKATAEMLEGSSPSPATNFKCGDIVVHSKPSSPENARRTFIRLLGKDRAHTMHFEGTTLVNSRTPLSWLTKADDLVVYFQKDFVRAIHEKSR